MFGRDASSYVRKRASLIRRLYQLRAELDKVSLKSAAKVGWTKQDIKKTIRVEHWIENAVIPKVVVDVEYRVVVLIEALALARRFSLIRSALLSEPLANLPSHHEISLPLQVNLKIPIDRPTPTHNLTPPPK
jgi:hypothetical protein